MGGVSDADYSHHAVFGQATAIGVGDASYKIGCKINHRATEGTEEGTEIYFSVLNSMPSVALWLT